MIKTSLSLLAVALSALAADRSQVQSGADAPPHVAEVLRLKEESVTLQYAASKHEATLVVQAESETALSRLELWSPEDRCVLRLTAGEGDSISLQGFDVETRETRLESLLQAYPSGRYDMRAWTSDGRALRGGAHLDHELLAEPAVIYPYPGAVNVPTNLTVAG